MRALWIIAGFTTLIIGVIGAFLPILPTTPLVILAAFCFGKGSPRLHGWLAGHSVFGPIIRDWEEHGAIAVRYRRMAYGAMALVFVVSLVQGLHPGILAVQAAGIGWAVWFISSKPVA